MNTVLAAITIALYLAAALLLVRRLARGATAAQSSKLPALLVGVVAVALHGQQLYGALLANEGLDLGLFNMFSLITWLMALLVTISAFGSRVENLDITALPLAAVGLLLQQWTGDNVSAPTLISGGLKWHILISVAAYSLLGIAVVQAVLLAIQDRHLRNHKPGGFIRALPPLESMERLLFQFIGSGFVLLTGALLSGLPYIEDIFAQHLVHKTVLSAAAWLLFSTLLYGRWRFGWRGRTAIRWTLSGFGLLLLAYFGSKLVLELILSRA